MIFQNIIKSIKLFKAVSKAGMWIDDSGTVHAYPKVYEDKIAKIYSNLDAEKFREAEALLNALRLETEWSNEPIDYNLYKFLVPELVRLGVIVDLEKPLQEGQDCVV